MCSNDRVLNPHLRHIFARMEISNLQDGHGIVSAMATPRLVVEHLMTVRIGPLLLSIHIPGAG